MPYKAFGVENRLAIPAAVKKAGTSYFGNKGFPGQYYNSAIFEAIQDHILGTEAQVKTLGEASIWYNGSLFKDKDDVTVTLANYDRINIVIDAMERDIVFPSVKLEFIAHSLVDMNGYDMTVADEVGGRIELIDNKLVGILNVTGQANALKIAKTTELIYIDVDDQGDNYSGVWSDGTYIFAACGGSGIRSYSVDGSGNLTFIDFDDQGDAYYDVWGDGTYIYAACSTGGIRSYSVDGSGNLTYIDVEDQGDVYYGVGGDGTYIFAACGDGGIRSYSVDGSGNLTYIDADDQGDTYNDIWGDGTYIYAACSGGGIRSYSVDGSGNLTFINVEDQGDNYYGVWGDGTYIFAACGDGGIRSYSVDSSGNLTFIDADAQGDTYDDIWGDGIYIFVACSGGGLRSYINIGNKYRLNFTGTGSIFEAGNLITP